ncbi:hypothetical protein IC229_05815 [Spirosoma sp. BT702]|uniref:Uncharacterized protein n=1 Tax=Spirosoma profusum TaxID=2771354 RepID=A0A926XY23_9BACT|nr:hypothetical protein [Spirosoma profusum]MBD2700142.1 hypothetical protein [Spirosoma profusum]
MLRSICTLLYFLLLPTFIIAQVPTIEWQKCLGGSVEERAYCIRQTTDGGYIVAGYTNSDEGDGDVTGNYDDLNSWIVKLNAAGGIQWQTCLGSNDYFDFITSIQQTTDGGYIVAGHTDDDKHATATNDVYSDGWVIKLGQGGVIQWQKFLGGSDFEEFQSIEQTTDGGYIVAGFTRSNDGDVSGNHGTNVENTFYPSRDIWVVKLSSSGNIQWQKCLGGTGSESAEFIQQTLDGGYIVGGSAYSTDGDVSGKHGFGYSDGWVVKLSPAGSIQWQKCLGGSADDEILSIQQTFDGGYITSGFTGSSDGDVSGKHGGNDNWVVRLSSSGAIQWQKCLGGSLGDRGYSIRQTTDGGYIVAGYTSSSNGDVSGYNGGTDCWIVKLNSSGNILWQKCLGGTNYETFYSIQQTTDGGYIATGYTGSSNRDVSGGHGSNDIWVVKLTGGPPPLTLQHFHQILNNSAFSRRELLQTAIDLDPQKSLNVCADGSSASIFKMYGGGIDYSQAVFKPSGSDVSQTGSFTVITQSRDSIIARYNHPDYIQGPAKSIGQLVRLFATPTSTSPIPLTSFIITVYRAPVFMVHGLWSDASCYSTTKSTLLSTGQYEPRFLHVVDYHETANRSFSVNVPKIPEQIDLLFYLLEREGISAGKVDYIGHSMGGILGRLYLQGPTSRDDVHKLITVNTPHSGSPMPSLLTSTQYPYTNYNACVIINKALGPFVGGACDGGSVDDLRVNSAAIRVDLNGATRTNNKVPAHAIVTTELTQSDTFGKRSKAKIFELVLDLYNVTPNALFQDDHDLVVAFNSQLGGMSGSCKSIFYNQMHIGSVGNPEVINKLIALLNSPTSTSFCTSGFNPITINPPVINTNLQAKTKAMTGSLHINSPSRGQYVANGQIITVSISASDVVNVRTYVGYNSDTLYSARSNGMPGSYTFVADGRFPGEKPVIVSGKASDGTIVTDTTHFYVIGACHSIASGNWSNAATWSCGHEPSIYEAVTINSGHTVTISTPTAQAYRLRYTGGKLIYTTGNNKVLVKGGS